MYDKPPYIVPGNDIYYQCADLVLTRDAMDAGAMDGGTDAGTKADGSGGCSITPGNSNGNMAFFLLLAGLLATLRHRKQ